MVGRAGIEPAESETPDLQSGPLPSTEYRPIYGGPYRDRTDETSCVQSKRSPN